MKRKLVLTALVLIIVISCALPALGAPIERFTDVAGLLSVDQAMTLNDRLNYLSEQLKFDIYIVTMDTLNGQDAGESAEMIYDHYALGYGPNRDGVILLISMEERDWAISSYGYGNEAINKDAIKYLSDGMYDQLHSGDYNGAFTTFADMSSRLVLDAMEGHPYKEPFHLVKSLLISFAISLVVALIVVGGMRSKLKSVHQKSSAADYVAPGSLQLTNSQEIFMYHRVTRTAKAQNNSGSRSSGSGHTTSSGKF